MNVLTISNPSHGARLDEKHGIGVLLCPLGDPKNAERELAAILRTLEVLGWTVEEDFGDPVVIGETASGRPAWLLVNTAVADGHDLDTIDDATHALKQRLGIAAMV